jgi:hypothetical protein
MVAAKNRNDRVNGLGGHGSGFRGPRENGVIVKTPDRADNHMALTLDPRVRRKARGRSARRWDAKAELAFATATQEH